MFERFTDDARAVVVGAQDQARRLGHHYIGTEHILLALAASDSETAALLRARGVTPDAVEAVIRRLIGNEGRRGPLDREALAAIGIDLDHVIDRIEAVFGPFALEPRTQRRRRWRQRSRSCTSGGRGGRTPITGHVPFTPRAKKCIELSLREAIALHDRNIGTQHLALGLTRGDGLAPQILAALGVSPRALHTEIRDRHRRAG